MFQILLDYIINKCNDNILPIIFLSNSQLSNLLIIDNNNNYIFKKIIEYKYNDTFKILYKLNLLPINPYNFLLICTLNNNKIVKLLINDSRISSKHSNYFNGFTFYPLNIYSNTNSLTIRNCCHYNNYKIVKLLLNKTNFEYDYEIEFNAAIYNKFYKLAKIVYNDIKSKNITLSDRFSNNELNIFDKHDKKIIKKLLKK